MQFVPSFALYLHRKDLLMTFEIKGGYLQNFLHQYVLYCFLIRYFHLYLCFISFPFVLSSFSKCFSKYMRSVLRHFLEMIRCLTLPYLDDFFLAPSPVGGASIDTDLGRLFERSCGSFECLKSSATPRRGF